MRTGRWKLLCEFDGSEVQLYDVENDRGETRNLAASHSNVAQKLALACADWQRGSGLKSAELTHELTQSSCRAHAELTHELTQSSRRAHAELTQSLRRAYGGETELRAYVGGAPDGRCRVVLH